MHRCLHIEEILTSIFEFVLYDVPRKGLRLLVYDKCSVLALVKTCRTFKMPALRVLWKNLLNPNPLFLTMPEDLWHVEEGKISYEPRTFSFKREIRPDDWERFDIYASFVWHLGVAEMGGLNSITFDDGVRRQLESRTPAVSLLPNLRTIVTWTKDLPFTFLFLTPRVHHLELVMYPNQVTTLSSLALEVLLRSPNLRSLHLIGFIARIWNASEKAQIFDALVELLKNFQLEEFVFNWFPLSQDVLNTVLGMPKLSTLNIHAAIPDLAQVMHTHPVQEARIRNFSLCAPLLIPSGLLHIISSLRLSKLEALTITSRCGRSCNATELTGLISTLVNSCSPEHLTDISVGSRHKPTYTRAIIDFKMLKPLLQFVHLRLISLPDHPFDLTDVEIKDMALAWPNLEELSYCQDQYMPVTDPKTSLRGLLWLATHCRKLHSLTFSFHASRGAVEELTENEMALAEGHNLNILDVGFSRILGCAEEVVRFIKRVFPNLTLLAFRHGRPNTEQWEEVEELIQVS